MSSVVQEADRRQAIAELSSFRLELYAAVPRRADALFEVGDALLCTDGPVRTLVELALAPEHQRSHNSLYAALNQGDLDTTRLRTAIATRDLPRGPGRRIVLAVDVSRIDVASSCWNGSARPSRTPQDRSGPSPASCARTSTPSPPASPWNGAPAESRAT